MALPFNATTLRCTITKSGIHFEILRECVVYKDCASSMLGDGGCRWIVEISKDDNKTWDENPVEITLFSARKTILRQRNHAANQGSSHVKLV